VSDAAARIAVVLGKEKPSPQPVLRGLIEETTKKKIDAYERRIKSLEDMMAAKKNVKKVKGDGTKPKSILRTGTSIAVKSSAPKTTKSKTSSKKSSALKGRDASNSATASAKGRKKSTGRKVSFAGKKVSKLTNSKK
jgi:hypothetical protein